MGSSGELPGIGWDSLALTFGCLGLVCLMAWMSLRLLSRRMGAGAVSGPVRVVARCPLEPRRSVYLVEALGRCFLVGVGDGPMALLAELDASALQRQPKHGAAALRFGDVLGRVLRRRAPAARRPGEVPSPGAVEAPGVDAGAAP